jgi:adenylylsulfate kinase-like enzyme
MIKKILIMGLPGAGKSTLAKELQRQVVASGRTIAHFNADEVRTHYNDWDFSPEGRVRQAFRMRELAASVAEYVQFAICDLVCPTPDTRDAVSPDYIVWVDTIQQSQYADTNAMFVPPSAYDIRVTSQDAETWAKSIIDILI